MPSISTSPYKYANKNIVYNDSEKLEMPHRAKFFFLVHN